MRPRSLRGWHWRLIQVAAHLFLLGFGFIGGWLLVRLPNSQRDESMPAPAWLLWTGILSCLTALVMWAIALCTAPLYDSDIPSDHLVPMEPLAETVLLVGCLCLGLVVSAIVSSESAYRWAPLFFVVLVVVTAAVGVGSNRS